MKWVMVFASVGCWLSLAVEPARAAEPPAPVFGPSPYAPDGCLIDPAMGLGLLPSPYARGWLPDLSRPSQPGTPGTEQPGVGQQPTVPSDAFSQAPEAGTQTATSYAPTMFGDLPGFVIKKVVRIPHTVRVTRSQTISVPTVTTFVGTPVAVSIPPGATSVIVPTPLVFPPNGNTVTVPTQVIPVSQGGSVPPGAQAIATTTVTAVGTTSQTISVTSTSTSFRNEVVTIPVPGPTAFKISENESPRPQCRAFFTYNFYDDVGGSINGPGVPGSQFNREVIGFEVPFFQGDASFGLRLPFVQQWGNQFVDDSQVGDISLVFKYAVINDPFTGNVLSGGLVLTVPSGESTSLFGLGDIHPTLLQPWAGAIVNFGNFYVHGFSSVVVPTDDRVATILFNDVGIGYLWRNGSRHSYITGIVPTLECHVNTPLEELNSGDIVIGIPDIVDLTAGTYLMFAGGSTLGVGFATPVTGPKPFDFEVLASLNFRF